MRSKSLRCLLEWRMARTFGYEGGYDRSTRQGHSMSDRRFSILSGMEEGFFDLFPGQGPDQNHLRPTPLPVNDLDG